MYCFTETFNSALIFFEAGGQSKSNQCNPFTKYKTLY